MLLKIPELWFLNLVLDVYTRDKNLFPRETAAWEGGEGRCSVNFPVEVARLPWETWELAVGWSVWQGGVNEVHWGIPASLDHQSLE